MLIKNYFNNSTTATTKQCVLLYHQVLSTKILQYFIFVDFVEIPISQHFIKHHRRIASADAEGERKESKRKRELLNNIKNKIVLEKRPIKIIYYGAKKQTK